MSLFDRLASELESKTITKNNLGKDNLGPVEFCEKYFNDKFAPEIKNVMNSVLENRVTLVQSANAVGKTHCAARVALWWYLAYNDSKVFTACPPPLENLEQLLWGEIGAVISKFPKVFEGHNTKSLNISTTDDHYLVGVAIPNASSVADRKARFSGKHAPHLLFILDEGDGIPWDIYEAIESCMSGGIARLLVLFNPRQRGGPIQRLEKFNSTKLIKLSAVEHPNVISGDPLLYPGAVTRETVVSRIEGMTIPVPDEMLQDYEDSNESLFEVPYYLRGSLADPSKFRKIMVPIFSTMVAGEYPPTSSYAVFSKEWLDKAFKPRLMSHSGEKIAGLDVAEYGQDSTVLAMLQNNEITRIWSWTGLNTLQTSEYVAEILKKEGCRKVVVDGNGVGSGVWPLLHKSGLSVCRFMSTNRPSAGAGEYGTFANARAEMYWRFREWMENGGIIFNDPQLKEELEATTYEIRNGKIYICSKDDLRKKLGRSPDRADACAYCFYATSSHYIESTQTKWRPLEKETMAKSLDLTFPRPLEWATAKYRRFSDNPNCITRDLGTDQSDRPGTG